jgi:hypothetical protein
MERLLSLLPTAKVFVDEREEAAYKRVVPKGQLILHEPTETFVEVRRLQFTDERFNKPMICAFDDDFRGCTAMVGQKVRSITDPGSILQIIISTATVARDIGAPIFGWNRQAHPGAFRPHDPFSFVAPCAGGWGQSLPPGERILPDRRLYNQEDLDCAMQALLKKRILFVDNRHYMDFGLVGQGVGGNQISRSSDREKHDDDLLKSKWAGCIDIGARKPMKGKSMGGRKMSVKVKRKSKLVDLK